MRMNQVSHATLKPSTGARLSSWILLFFSALLLVGVLVGYGYTMLFLMPRIAVHSELSSYPILRYMAVIGITIVVHICAHLMMRFSDYLVGKMKGMTEREILAQVLWKMGQEFSMVLMSFSTMASVCALMAHRWVLFGVFVPLVFVFGYLWNFSDKKIKQSGMEPEMVEE